MPSRPRTELPVLAEPSEPAASGRFKAVILYFDLPEARHVMLRIDRRLREQQPVAVLQPMLWRLDQLQEPRWRKLSLVDAARAHWIVFAMRPALAFSTATSRWLGLVLALRQGTAIQVVAACGNEEPWFVTLEGVPGRAETPMAISDLTNAFDSAGRLRKSA